MPEFICNIKNIKNLIQSNNEKFIARHGKLRTRLMKFSTLNPTQDGQNPVAHGGSKCCPDQQCQITIES